MSPARATRATVALVWIALVWMSDVVSRAPDARADPSNDNRAAAQVLFDRGRELVESNHFAEACPQFAESQRLDPGIGTLLWLADCYENIGQTASAWTAFSQAAADAAERRDPRATVARARAAKLEATLSRLTIVVSPEASAASDLQIRCDGVLVSRASWGRAVPIDPGLHTITAHAANHQLWWTTAQLALGSSGASVVVPALGTEAAAPVAAPTGLVVGPSPVGETQPSAAQHPGHAQRVVAVALAGAGATAVVVGSFFSLRAKSKYDESNDGPCLADNECTPAGMQERQSATSTATVATIAMGGGVAVLAGAAAIYLAAPRDAPAKVAFSPDPRGGGSVDMTWRW